MSRQGVNLSESGAGAVEAPTDDPLIGTALGSYELVGRIGAGDLGVVYRAYHRLLGQERALKLLPAHLSDDQEYVEPFIREARLAASLKHPNIVQLHDVGIDERFYYTVMELLPGQSLTELLRVRHRLPSARSLHLLEQLAGALDYAHDRDIAHHDLKPANIMVGPGDHATLVDFGIARALDGTQLTSTGRDIGTVAYLAPETILGTGGGITADQYAVGVLAYELLVGRLPFPGSDTEAVMEAHAHQPPPPPREIRPELTEAVEQVLLRQLSKNPDERYHTLIELVMALRTAMETRPSRHEAAAHRSAAGPRQPDPWTTLQMELQEKHRSQQGAQPEPARTSRRTFLIRTGTLAASTVAGGWLAWSLLRGRSAPAVAPGQAPSASDPRTTGTGGPAAAPSPIAPVESPTRDDDEPTSASPGRRGASGPVSASDQITARF